MGALLREPLELVKCETSDVLGARPRRDDHRGGDPARRADARGSLRRVHRLQPGRAAARGGQGQGHHPPRGRLLPGHHGRPPRPHAALHHPDGGQPLPRGARHGAVGQGGAGARTLHLLRLARAAAARPGQERHPLRARRRHLHEARGGGRPGRGHLRRPAGDVGHRHPLPARPRHHHHHPRARLRPRSVHQGGRLLRQMGRGRDGQALARRLHPAPPGAAGGLGSGST